MQPADLPPMYRLGQLARLLFGSEVPDNVRDKMMREPLAGLALAMSKADRRQPAAKADRNQLSDEVASIVAGMPADGWPSPVTHQHRGQWTAGYFSFLARKDLAAVLTAEHLRAMGETLYGTQWQSDLARALNLDSRRIRQWIAGDRPIPSGVWTDIAGLLQARQIATGEALQLLSELADKR